MFLNNLFEYTWLKNVYNLYIYEISLIMTQQFKINKYLCFKQYILIIYFYTYIYHNILLKMKPIIIL